MQEVALGDPAVVFGGQPLPLLLPPVRLLLGCTADLDGFLHRLFDLFRETLDTLFEGLPEPITEENIQARIRGNLLMALSNRDGALVLSTGNKSELAVGYCTLYGDMSGGLAVIADVPKTMVYELARHLNRDGKRIPETTISSRISRARRLLAARLGARHDSRGGR